MYIYIPRPPAYSNFKAYSENGSFVLEVESASDGTMEARDFRFQLFHIDASPEDSHGRSLVWERIQEPGEEFPVQALVSDDGWTVIVTTVSPEILVFSPLGRLTLRLGILESQNELNWKPKCARLTEYGVYWRDDSWQTFFSHNGRTYFSWRASSGERLVIDLSEGSVCTDQANLSADLITDIFSAEAESVIRLLDRMSRYTPTEISSIIFKYTYHVWDHRKNAPYQDIASARAALYLVGVHRIRACIPALRQWEQVGWSGNSIKSQIFFCGSYFREIVNASLKLLDEQPYGFPSYSPESFLYRIGLNEILSKPLQRAERSERAKNLNEGLLAYEVLISIGGPDFIRCASPTCEEWEYDFRDQSAWKTLRITWGKKEEKDGSAYRIQCLEWLEPYWLNSDDRDAQILDWERVKEPLTSCL